MRSNFAPGALGTLPVTRRPVRGWRSIRSASRPAGIAPRRARARHRTLVSEIDSDSSCSTETLDVRRPPQQLPVLVPVDVHVSFRDFPERVVRPSERRVAGACHHRPYVAEPLGSHRSVSGEVVAAEDMVPVSAGAASPPPLCSETARTPFGRTCDCASSRPRSRALIAALLDSACGGLSCPRAVSFSPGASSRASLSRVARVQGGPPRSSPASTCGVISIGISPPPVERQEFEGLEGGARPLFIVRRRLAIGLQHGLSTTQRRRTQQAAGRAWGLSRPEDARSFRRKRRSRPEDESVYVMPPPTSTPAPVRTLPPRFPQRTR